MDQTNHLAQRTEDLRAWLEQHKDVFRLTEIETRAEIPATKLGRWINGDIQQGKYRGQPYRLTDVQVENLERVLTAYGYVPVTNHHQFL